MPSNFNPNPFLMIRTYRGLTQKQIGFELDLTEQTVANYEAGLISEPPEKVLELYLRVWDPPVGRGGLYYDLKLDWECKYSPAGLLKAYEDFQYAKRVHNGVHLMHKNASMVGFKPGKNGHPFLQWRERAVGNRKRFCMLFCVPYASLERYENGGYLVPGWLRRVLYTAGVGRDELDTMDTLIKDWYKEGAERARTRR